MSTRHHAIWKFIQVDIHADMLQKASLVTTDPSQGKNTPAAGPRRSETQLETSSMTHGKLQPDVWVTSNRNVGYIKHKYGLCQT